MSEGFIDRGLGSTTSRPGCMCGFPPEAFVLPGSNEEDPADARHAVSRSVPHLGGSRLSVQRRGGRLCSLQGEVLGTWQSTGIAYARYFIKEDPCPREVLGTCTYAVVALRYPDAAIRYHPSTFFYIVRQVHVAFLQTVATRQLLNSIDTSL